MKIKHALNTAAIAMALAFSGASHAERYSNEAIEGASGIFNNFGGTLLTTSPGVPILSVTAYEMKSLDTPTNLDRYLAFCIEPTVVEGAGYVTDHALLNMDLQFGSKAHLVKALYETSYKTLFAASSDLKLSADEMKQAFQLALWDAGNDDGNINSGLQSFILGSDDGNDLRVLAAQSMLSAAANLGTLSNRFDYITFTAPNGNLAGQTLMAVTAVPEADTWAMLAAGLGLVGFMGRRQSRRSDKFAA